MAKVLVSIPDDLLARVDREAKRRRTSRSAFLRDAARRELGWTQPQPIDAAVEKARDALRTVPATERDSGQRE
jgi:metal-responsive CopG/Arc/MetJ family transcriptional regulator